MKSKFYIHSQKAKTIKLVLALLAFFIIIINIGHLRDKPFSRGIFWDEPKYGATNSSDTIAIVDSIGSRITVVSKDRDIIRIIDSNTLSSIKIANVTSISLNDDALYILDHEMSSNGAEIMGDKVYRYSVSSDETVSLYETPDNSVLNICNVYFKDDKCIVAGFENGDECFIVIGQLSDGSIREMYRFSCGSDSIYSVTYNPNTDSCCAITNNGKLLVWENGSFAKSIINDSKFFADAVCTDGGSLLYLDTIRNAVYMLDSDESMLLVNDTFAARISEKNDQLFLCDPIKNTITIKGLTDGFEETFDTAYYEASYIFGRIITYICLLYIAVVAITGLTKGIVSLVKASRQKSIENARRKHQKSQYQTISKIISDIAPSFVVAFLIAATVFSMFFWSREIDSKKIELINLSLGMYNISGSTVGNSISNIHSDSDYDSDAYKNTISIFSGICGTSSGSYGFDCGYSIYKFIDGSDDVMVIKDKFDEDRLGSIISRYEQESLIMSDRFDVVKDGNIDYSLFKFSNGTGLMCLTFPLTNSQDDIVGCAELSLNYSALKSNTIRELATVLIEIITITAGIMILFAEFILARELIGLQLIKIEEGKTDNALAESEHTLKVICRCSLYMIFVFITLIAKEILDEQGISNSVLLALPLTLSIVFSYVTKIISQLISFRKPDNVMNIGIAIEALGAMICLYAVIQIHYISLCIGSSLIGFGVMLCYGGISDGVSLGKKTTDRYDGLETDRLICPPLATALGSVARMYFGNVVFFILILVLCGLMWVSKTFFLSEDTAPVSGEKRISLQSSLIAKALHHPKIVICSMITLLAFNLFYMQGSYVLPIFVQMSEFSEIFISTMTILILFITLYVLPYLRKWMNSFHPVVTQCVSYGIIAVSFLIFARTDDLKVFSFILIVIAILSEALLDSSDAILMKIIGPAGTDMKTVNAINDSFDLVFSISMPIILSVLLSGGNAVMGYAICGFCILCAAIMFFVYSDNKTSMRSFFNSK